MNDNIKRCLKNVVSLDGWIGEFADEGKANVHVDVVFRDALFGDKPDHTVTFKLTLKRAEVFLLVGDDDPIKVVRSTIRRTVSDATISQKQESTVEQSGKARAGGKVSKLGVPGHASTEGEINASKKTTNSSKQAIREYVVQHFVDGANPAWDVSRHDGKPMGGAPWDANHEPRLKVKRKPPAGSNEQLAIKLELRCRRQDLVISEIAFIDPKKKSLFNTGKFQTQKLVAAEQVIKDELSDSGLLTNGDLSKDAVTLLIADTIIFEED
ncbi:MAG: hypothetical protein GQ535_13670 [Rhodobacteraceae bacterium]|nr:hypothetical protein [Paracoccaceae bacterium]